jgi:serine/threonine protein phosphatase PrpC
MRHISWQLSDVGKKRDHNEDSFLVDEALSLYVVADGMGGHQGGDFASRMAVETVRREVADAGEVEAAARRILDADPTLHLPPSRMGQLKDAEQDTKKTLPPTADQLPGGEAVLTPPPAAATVLRAAARVAGRTIFDAAQSDARLAGMGTTLTALLIHKDRAHVAHVGDSRLFLFRDGKVEQITEDHSWIAEQVRAGMMSEDEARDSKFKHIITRSVGFEREVDVDTLGIPVAAGDCFLLCSDGMSNYTDKEELGRILSSTYYRKVPQLLVDLANDRGGDDNITVVVVYVANEKTAGA